MAYCENCINAVESNLPEGGLYCMLFRSLCGDTIGCSNGVDGKRKAKTNADRIRAMTDEELAMEICTDFGGIPWCKNIPECQDSLCVGCVVKWLKQEAEE